MGAAGELGHCLDMAGNVVGRICAGKPVRNVGLSSLETSVNSLLRRLGAVVRRDETLCSNPCYRFRFEPGAVSGASASTVTKTGHCLDRWFWRSMNPATGSNFMASEL
jgi:hypothetical protein